MKNIIFTTDKAMKIEEIIEVLINELEGNFPDRLIIKINEDTYDISFGARLIVLNNYTGELILYADYSEYGLNPEDPESYSDIEYGPGAILEVLEII